MYTSAFLTYLVLLFAILFLLQKSLRMLAKTKAASFRHKRAERVASVVLVAYHALFVGAALLWGGARFMLT